MNMQEMIDAIHEHNGNLKKTDIMSVLKLQGDVAQATLSYGNEVTLHGIGKLKTKECASRTGRNPHTGEEMFIPSKTGVKFTAAKALKDAVT